MLYPNIHAKLRIAIVHAWLTCFVAWSKRLHATNILTGVFEFKASKQKRNIW